ncbi:MAG: glycosyltransferase [Candidatus Buchananbacteria bacterium]
MDNDKKLNILMLSFDWRNIFSTDFDGMKSKLGRDHLEPNHNNFFIFSWSNDSYFKKIDNFETVHFKARWKHFRVAYDFLTFFMLPLTLHKYKFKPDVIICYDFPFVLSCVIPKVLWGGRILVILSALPSQLAGTRGLFGFVRVAYQRLVEKLAINFIDDYFAIGEATKKYLLDLGVKKEVMIMPPDTFSQWKTSMEKVREGEIKNKYGIGGTDKKIILSVGRLEVEKNYDNLLIAWSKMKTNDWILIIAGEGSLLSKLRDLSKQLNIEKNVIFAGRISREEIWSYYKDASAFVLFSKSEGLGLVFWEAMIMNVSCIGSRVGGIIDSIGANEERGFFGDPGNPSELESIISQCINRDQEVREKIVRARQYVEDKASFCYNINNYYKDRI